MRLRIDSNESQEVEDALKDEGFTVERGWILAYKCTCGRVFKPTLYSCPSCKKDVVREGDEKTEQVRVCDIIEPNWVFGIERKAEGDYRASCKDGRIYNQMKDMAMCFGKDCGIMLEGTLDGVCYDEPQFANWFRSIEGWCWNIGIHFVEAGSMEGIAKRIKVIYERIGEDWKERPCTKNMPDVDQSILALMECSGVGFEKAQMYFFYWKSLRAMANLSKVEWMVIPGTGAKTAEKLVNFFTKEVKVKWLPKK